LNNLEKPYTIDGFSGHSLRDDRDVKTFLRKRDQYILLSWRSSLLPQWWSLFYFILI